jgi:putative ABC transport system permease protein
MIRNYLLTAWRHLFKQRGYSLINLAGLAVGLATFIVIALFVRYELSYDGYHANADRIYRFSRDFYASEGQEASTTAANGAAAGPLLVQDFPQIEKMARVANCGGNAFGVLIVSENVGYFEDGYATADNSIFEIFDFEWLHGDQSTALVAPLTITLSESAAIKYFGKVDAVGETLFLENTHPMEVTGIFADLPSNTHFGFTMLGSLLNATVTGVPTILEGWWLNCYHTYGLLSEGADVGLIQSQSDEFTQRHLGENVPRPQGFLMQPLRELHLTGAREGEMTQPGSRTSVLSFAAIALFVLILAAINFVNLATARASLRAREVGVRKTVGAGRLELFAQFMGESVLIAVLASLASVVLIMLALPIFGEFVRRDLDVSLLREPAVLAFMATSAVLVGLIAGSYPSMFLSGFRPARVLRGDVTRGTAAGVLRKVLVVGQFAISVALIIAAIVVYQQMQYARSIELGYNKDQVVLMRGSPTRGVASQWEPMRQRWLAHPEIVEVTASRQVPGRRIGETIEVGRGTSEPVSMGLLPVQFGFFETYEIEMIAGRAFSEDFGIDLVRVVGEGDEQTMTGSFVVSAMAARRLGAESPEEIVGELMNFSGVEGTVVGVARDVYFSSAHVPIEPTVYYVPESTGSRVAATFQFASIRVTGNDLADTLEYIDAAWQEFEPDQPVTRRFLDQDFQALYENEERQARMLLAFSLLAVFIACLGLFGLATFAIEQRTKEIGIRKVMGGTVFDIVKLFLFEFGWLVLVASLIAWPVAYFAMSRWLETFAYRIDPGLLAYVGSTAIALIVAGLTVGGAALRAAVAKPIHALRYE